MHLNKYLRKFRIFIHKFMRKKGNGYNHIISLGYNCEVSFRFVIYFKFEETSVFNWSFSNSIENLIYALNNFEKLGKDEFNRPNPLWECKNTHILFHGRESMDTYLNHKETEQILIKDLEELKNRLRYLKKKFIRVAQSHDSKLYIYKIGKHDIDKNVKKKLLDLYYALENLGAINFKLLIVYEKSNFIPEDMHYILRTVDYFAADHLVTDSKYMNNGWDKIYDEFYQNKKIDNKNKKYKFQR